MEKGTTLHRFINQEQRRFPEARGDFSELLFALAIAGKLISRELNKAGLAQVMGLTGHVNVHGEEVQKLDEFANSTIIHATEHTGHLAAMASEEMETVYTVPPEYPDGDYLLVFDPVDGSSNIDVNVSVGTIFSIYRRRVDGGTTPAMATATEKDFLNRGNEQVCAGYIIYGSSTMLVFTSGRGTHGFTLDPSLGEFLLSHGNIRIPSRAATYSANEGNTGKWFPCVRQYVDSLKQTDVDRGRPYSARYIGSLVSDFHRNLLKGGIFLYPGDREAENGKLRLLYEAAPLAFVVEQAGGRASDGTTRILDLLPTGLHQRTPLIIGSAEDVGEAESHIRGAAS